jgi:hypothetical protein
MLPDRHPAAVVHTQCPSQRPEDPVHSFRGGSALRTGGHSYLNIPEPEPELTAPHEPLDGHFQHYVVESLRRSSDIALILRRESPDRHPIR